MFIKAGSRQMAQPAFSYLPVYVINEYSSRNTAKRKRTWGGVVEKNSPLGKQEKKIRPAR